MKELEPLEADHTKLKANFVGCEITRGWLRNQPLAAKWCPSHALYAPSEHGPEARLSFSNTAQTRGALPTPSMRRTTRQRASSPQVPSDSPSQVVEALRIPYSEGEEATGPSSPTSQHRYEMRRPPTILGATTSRSESSVRRPPAKRARTLSQGQSSRASEPPADSKLPSNMSLESIIRRPMGTALPIKGNSDCRARPFHSELYVD
uniref:Uncharacterized protein n=1 Tax=Vitis vinifera TaxID=29760 RepID=A5AQQ2_VITVI|nr:hypothetical protein VITISV_043186 [Vitis vinifera]